MVPERAADPSGIYEAKRLELIALARTLQPDQLATRVPATPAWDVHDVVAHVVGIAADLNAQRFGDLDDPDAWTASQVAVRQAASVEDLAREWDREAPQFETGLRLFGYAFGAHYVGDLLQHVADIRHALGQPGLTDDLGLAVGLDMYLETFEEALDAAGLAVVVTAGPDRFTLGTGPPVAALAGERFELFRALGGRRTEAEIRALAWEGDRDRVVPLVSAYPLPGASLNES